VFREWPLYVPEVGCGYTEVQLATTTTLQGVVLDERGKPAPNIPVGVQLAGKDMRLQKPAWPGQNGINPYALRAMTDDNGRFKIAGLPEMDAFLSAGSDYPTTGMPYRRVYYPEGCLQDKAAALRLKPGEHRESIVLRLGAPLQRASATVRVTFKQGRPGANANVWALDSGDVIAEASHTDGHGVARIPCLRGLKYELEARTLPPRSSQEGDILKSSRVPFVCADHNGVFKLVLNHLGWR
jgi:hypothetical protein